MNTALEHRGPDDGGQVNDPGCSIAMRRLSIIDLTTGHQPIENEDGTLVIVFNGEIYNFSDLRKQLLHSGRHVFRTKTDTEVILHLYEEHGWRTPELLKGMFAFCIYDRRDNSIFLARDRFGEKPLYYSCQGNAIAFSSEIASLLEWPLITRKLDYEALFYLLHLGYAPSPSTLFKEIRQLPAGHSMKWQGGNLDIRQFYHPEYTPDPALRDERLAVEALRDALEHAVARQMIADVPLGAFLSGGIDSSTIVAAMQRQSGQPVRTFTARFEYTPFDESGVAKTVADHLGTHHQEVVVTNRSFEDEDMWRILRHFGQPFLDSSAIPTYLVSREISKHVSVALSGDGGDEIFAGYHFFQTLLAVDQLAAMPRPLIAAGAATLNRLSQMTPLGRFSALRMARRAAYITSVPKNVRPGLIENIFDTDELLSLASPQLCSHWATASDTMTPRMLESVGYASRLRQLMHYRVKYSLSEDMLAKVDRMSMATSLEVRAPLLSAEVTDLAMRLPDDLLIRRGVMKYILRQAGRPWLPEVVYSHPKVGFSIPLHMFQNDTYHRLCHQYLADGTASFAKSLFGLDALRRIMDTAHHDRVTRQDISVRRASHQLWAILQVSAWGHHYKVSL